MVESKIVEIYALRHPITKEIRYIGKANNSAKRLKSHLLDANRRKYPVYNWINKLKSENLIPEIEILEITDSINWKEAEIRIISEYKTKGYKLLNVAAGGDEPYCSTETRRNNGRMNAKAIHSDEKRKRFWYLKHELGIYFKNSKASPHAIELKRRLNLCGIFFK